MPKTVLVVDDSATQRAHLKAVLEQEGYTVVTLCDGPAALETIQAQPPDLVLADVLMTPMDGYELCRQIKSSPATQKTPVILISTLGKPTDNYWAQYSQVDAYLTKTADPSQMLETIRRLLL
ncbi:MAG: response regulator [Candidatus Eremiobacteraeota bacterium]|nr:response regulator [Candidatus Eremiobacteraeota bacterium]MBC5828156.1 response regulator [Candidatus Eremiobacteraeota bacterium]